MSPRDFLAAVVQPNVDNFEREIASLLMAFNAIAAVDALAAHIFAWCQVHKPAEVDGLRDDSEYRASLSRRDAEFALLRDVAKAQKHVRLVQGQPKVSLASQIRTDAPPFGAMRWGEFTWGGEPHVVVTTDAGEYRSIVILVRHALQFLRDELDRIGVP